MKRGVIDLNQQELSLIRSLQLPLSPLSRKLAAVRTNHQSCQIQLGADEVDQILDALPAPDPQDPKSISLRQKLQQVLI